MFIYYSFLTAPLWNKNSCDICYFVYFFVAEEEEDAAGYYPKPYGGYGKKYGHGHGYGYCGRAKAADVLNNLLQDKGVTSRLTLAENLKNINLVCSCVVAGTSDKKKVTLKKICVEAYKYGYKKCYGYGKKGGHGYDGCCERVVVHTRKINLNCQCYTTGRYIMYSDLVSTARSAAANGWGADGKHCSDYYYGGHGHKGWGKKPYYKPYY